MVEKLTALVEKAMKGDREAFEELIAKKQREILYITSHFCNPQDLEDYAQEALILMYKNLNQLKDPACFNDWMYNIIRNTCFSHNRKKNNRTRIAEMTSFDPAADGILNTMEENREEFLPVEYLEREEKRAQVMEAINTLPDNYRECLLLFFYEEMSYKEIARALQTNTKTVGNNLLRAKNLLKKRLDEARKKHEIFSISALPAVPVLTQIFREDAKAKISQELCDKMVQKTAANLTGLGAAQGAAKAAGSTAITKTVIGVVSVLTITGLTMGTLHYVNRDVPQAGIPIHGLQPARPEFIPAAKQAAKELVKPINTLADMIGKEQEEKLLTYEKEGVSQKTWAQFIKDIGAEEKTRTETMEGDLYILYVLEKQDKQLLLVTRQRPGSGELHVMHEFGKIKEIPDMLHFILAFNNL